MTAHKTDSHAKRGRRAQPPKEKATFDTELQRYMPGEHRATVSKQSKSE